MPLPSFDHVGIIRIILRQPIRRSRGQWRLETVLQDDLQHLGIRARNGDADPTQIPGGKAFDQLTPGFAGIDALEDAAVRTRPSQTSMVAATSART